MIKFLDKKTNKFVDNKTDIYLGVDGKIYTFHVFESYLERTDVSDQYTIYYLGLDLGTEEVKLDRLDAFQLREKIGIDTSISGKGLVDLSKEGH